MSLPCKSHCKAALHALADTMPSVAEMRRPTSLYEVLRVNRNTSQVEIKTTYCSLAKMYNPDSSECADGRDFIQIHKAYATLSDPAARALDDLSLCAAAAASGRERRPFRRKPDIRPGIIRPEDGIRISAGRINCRPVNPLQHVIICSSTPKHVL